MHFEPGAHPRHRNLVRGLLGPLSMALPDGDDSPSDAAYQAVDSDELGVHQARYAYDAHQGSDGRRHLVRVTDHTHLLHSPTHDEHLESHHRLAHLGVTPVLGHHRRATASFDDNGHVDAVTVRAIHAVLPFKVSPAAELLRRSVKRKSQAARDDAFGGVPPGTPDLDTGPAPHCALLSANRTPLDTVPADLVSAATAAAATTELSTAKLAGPGRPCGRLTGAPCLSNATAFHGTGRRRTLLVCGQDGTPHECQRSQLSMESVPLAVDLLRSQGFHSKRAGLAAAVEDGWVDHQDAPTSPDDPAFLDYGDPDAVVDELLACASALDDTDGPTSHAAPSAPADGPHPRQAGRDCFLRLATEAAGHPAIADAVLERMRTTVANVPAAASSLPAAKRLVSLAALIGSPAAQALLARLVLSFPPGLPSAVTGSQDAVLLRVTLLALRQVNKPSEVLVAALQAACELHGLHTADDTLDELTLSLASVAGVADISDAQHISVHQFLTRRLFSAEEQQRKSEARFARHLGTAEHTWAAAHDSWRLKVLTHTGAHPSPHSAAEEWQHMSRHERHVWANASVHQLAAGAARRAAATETANVTGVPVLDAVVDPATGLPLPRLDTATHHGYNRAQDAFLPHHPHLVAAFMALANFDDPRGVELVARHATSRHRLLRSAALFTLGRFSHVSAASHLAAAASEPSEEPAIRLHALERLHAWHAARASRFVGAVTPPGRRHLAQARNYFGDGAAAAGNVHGHADAIVPHLLSVMRQADEEHGEDLSSCIRACRRQCKHRSTKRCLHRCDHHCES